MGTKVVGFKIEIKGQKDVVTTTKLLGLLNTQLILIGNTLSVLDKEYKNNSSSASQMNTILKASLKGFQQGNKVVKDLGNGYFEVTKQVSKVSKEIKENEKAVESDSDSIKGLIKRNKDLKKSLLEQTSATGEQSDATRKLGKEYAKNNDVIKEFRKELRTGKKASEAQKGSLDELRKSAIKLKKQYNALGESQRKGLEGKKIQKSLAITEKRIQKLDLAVRSGKTSIGLYGNATRKLGGTLLKLSVGRDIIRGLFQGLAGIVDKNKDIDESAKSISTTFDKLKNAAEKFGLLFIKFVAGPLELFVDLASSASKAIFGVGFEAEKASVGVRDLQNEFNAEIEVLKRGNISTEARKQLISDINKKYEEYLPNLLSENATLVEIEKAQNAANKAFTKKITLLASEEQFVDLTKRRLDALRQEVLLNTQLEKANETAARFAGATDKVGRDANALARKGIDIVQERLSANRLVIDQIEEEKRVLDEVIKSEGINTSDFISNQEVKTDAELKGIAKRESAREKAAKKIQDDLKKARANLLKQIETESLARIKLAVDLGTQLRQLQIQSISDTTAQSIAAEKERFNLESAARKANFEARKKEVSDQEAEIIRLFGIHSQEFTDFIAESESELLDLSKTSDAIAELQAQNHQDALLKIETDGIATRKAADKKAFDDETASTEAEYEAREQAEGEASDKLIAAQIEADKKANDQRKERNQATKDALVGLVGAVFSAISDISRIAFEAENARFEDAIQSRQDNISKLNEDLQNATGLQKKFLEKQIEQEQKALQAETEAKEQARKEQGEAQKAISITQAIIAAALGIANAFSLPPPASFIAAAATAVATGAQIAVIASQKFARGGILNGNSHANGGIQTRYGELEGGEAVINKVSTRRHAALLSAINVDGGGKKFAGGGVLGAPISAPSIGNAQSDIDIKFNQFMAASMASTAATNQRIDNINVNLDLNNLEDVQGNDTELEAMTTL